MKALSRLRAVAFAKGRDRVRLVSHQRIFHAVQQCIRVRRRFVRILVHSGDDVLALGAGAGQPRGVDQRDLFEQRRRQRHVDELDFGRRKVEFRRQARAVQGHRRALPAVPGNHRRGDESAMAEHVDEFGALSPVGGRHVRREQRVEQRRLAGRHTPDQRRAKWFAQSLSAPPARLGQLRIVRLLSPRGELDDCCGR